VLTTFLACAEKKFNWLVAIFAIITTLLLQIISNFANDYGDYLKGSDIGRKGPARALQNGLISPHEMRNALVFLCFCSLISGSILIFLAASNLSLRVQIGFLIVGLMAIYAAVKYTVGKSPYGYKGWGDLFVFIFFGIVSTMGSYILYTGQFNWLIVLPSISIGLLSTGVLNINNIRDYQDDLKNNKKTLAVILGLKNAKKYHTCLIIIALFCNLAYVCLNFHSVFQLIFILTLPLFIKNINKVSSFNEPSQLNNELKNLSMSTFILAILFGLGQILP
jgi:1,4-dihydroxy-2-naphthoate octaprenyltransferase